MLGCFLYFKRISQVDSIHFKIDRVLSRTKSNKTASSASTELKDLVQKNKQYWINS